MYQSDKSYSFPGFDASTLATFKTPVGSGPRHFAQHPNGKFLYLSAELTNTVHVYSVDPATGELVLKQSLSSLPDTFKVRRALVVSSSNTRQMPFRTPT